MLTVTIPQVSPALSGPDSGRRTPNTGLIRALITADGSVKANFADNTVVILHQTGVSFTVFANTSSQCMRQLTEYATRPFADKVAQVLAFRNMHLDQPYFCGILLQTSQRPTLFRTHTPVGAHWPRTVNDARAQNLVEFLSDGSTLLKCVEGQVRTVLAPHALHVSVKYPLLVAEITSDTPEFEYVWQTQVFSTADCPPRWHPALRMLVLLRRAHRADLAGLCRQEGSSAPEDPDIVREAEELCVSQFDCDASVTSAVTVLPTALHKLPVLWDRIEPGSWWRSASPALYPTEQAPMVEWTAAALLRVLPGSLEVEAALHSAGPPRSPAGHPALLSPPALAPAPAPAPAPAGASPSPSSPASDCEALLAGAQRAAACIRSTGGLRYFHHITAEAPADAGRAALLLEHVFAREAVPETSAAPPHGAEFTVAGIVRRAAALREAAVAAGGRWRVHPEGPEGQRLAFRTGEVKRTEGGRQYRRLEAVALEAPGSPGGPRPAHLHPLRQEDLRSRFQASGSVSSEVLEESAVPGVGHFVAYRDARVRAVFQDRTLLEMDATWSTCRLVLPRGDVREVRVGAAVGVEEYVQVAMEFAQWAARTPDQRARCMASLREHSAAIDAHLRSTNVFLALASGEVPEAPTTPPQGDPPRALSGVRPDGPPDPAPASTAGAAVPGPPRLYVGSDVSQGRRRTWGDFAVMNKDAAALGVASPVGSREVSEVEESVRVTMGMVGSVREQMVQDLLLRNTRVLDSLRQ